MSTLTIDVNKAADATIVTIAGSAGVATVAVLEREVTRLSATPHGLLILDLSALDSIASLSVSQFVMLQRAVQHRGGAVRIGGCSEMVRGVLVRCRLDTVMPIFDSVDDAMRPDA